MKTMGFTGGHHSETFKNKQSERYKGSGNPRWKGGERKYWYNYWKDYVKDKKCEVCNIKNDLVAHHRDRNWRNNIIENIQILCRSCHTKHHQETGDVRKKRIFKDRNEFYQDWKRRMRERYINDLEYREKLKTRAREYYRKKVKKEGDNVITVRI